MAIKVKAVTTLPKQFFQDYKERTVLERNGNLVFIEALDKGMNKKHYETRVVRVDEYGKEFTRSNGSLDDKAHDKALMKQRFDETILIRDKAEVNKAKKADSLKQRNELLCLNSLKISEGKQLRDSLAIELKQFVKEAKSMEQLLKDKAVVKILNDINNIETIFKYGGLQ